MSEDAMAMKVRMAAQKGLHVEFKEGTDAQICGPFLDVRAKMTEDSIHGEYLGWCSLRRRDELEAIIRDHRPRPVVVERTPVSDDLVDEISLLMKQCQSLEADRTSMDPDHANAQISVIRKKLEVLHERALTRRGP